METPDELEQSDVEAFSDRLRGPVLRPDDEGYDEARTVWNGMIDKYPALIARCTGTADVMAAVEFAREQELPLAIKGGGHHIAGHAVCDDGLVIDLAPMNGVRVDPDAKTVRVQGGATWGDLNHETWAFELDTVCMTYSDVGVAGFTLGGGMQRLSRRHGLAIDNLRSADVVTADGELVHASEDEHPDLFWALRGGSGNFGVVTSLEFDCHDTTLDALNGVFVYPIAEAKDVVRFYRDFMADAPDEVAATVGVLPVPASPEFPDDLHGEEVVMLIANYMGAIEEGERVLRPLQEFGEPLLDAVQPQRYSEMGSEFYESGLRNHWKSHFFAEITDEAIDTFVDRTVPVPEQVAHVNFYALGGAVKRVEETATAYPHRHAMHLMEIVTQWSDADYDEEVISWARGVHEAMAPYATGGEYVNNQTDDDAERVRAAYGDNYDRLVEVKNKWDPENVFDLNQNIEPSRN